MTTFQNTTTHNDSTVTHSDTVRHKHILLISRLALTAEPLLRKILLFIRGDDMHFKHAFIHEEKAGNIDEKKNKIGG